MKNVYGPDIEKQMRQLYESFSEKDRRRYAAVEAYKLGHGGVAYIAGLFGCHPDTIAQGKRDLENLPADEAAGRVRKKWADEKTSKSQPGVVQAIEAEVKTQTAGSPVRDGEIWTNIGLRVIASAIKPLGFDASPGVISSLLRNTLKLGRRKISKDIPLGSSEHRNDQFELLAELRLQYEQQGWQVLSVDTKKKELIGSFARSGQAWTDGFLHAFHHDFGSYSSEQKAIP